MTTVLKDKFSTGVKVTAWDFASYITAKNKARNNLVPHFNS